jgi:ribose/xylose/arabinose/galactoside ABC-type transport system permease subunit
MNRTEEPTIGSERPLKAAIPEKRPRSIEEGLSLRNVWQAPYTPGVVLLMIECLIFSIMTGGRFLGPDNLMTVVLVFFLEYALCTIGMTLVIIVRGIDLSLGGVLSLVSVMLGVTLQAGFPVAVAVALALLTGITCGLLNGVLVTTFRTPAIITTLGSGIMFYGLAVGWSKGMPYTVPEAFAWFGSGTVVGIPAQLLILLAVVIVSHTILAYSRFGRWIYAVGGNTTAAKYSGIPIKAVVLAIYTISGVLGSIAAVVICSRYHSAKALYGQGIELTLITAALLGGVNIAGGEGTVLGALLGMLTIAVAQNGMIIINVHSSYQGMVIAILVLVVLLVNRFLSTKRIAA